MDQHAKKLMVIRSKDIKIKAEKELLDAVSKA